MQNIIFKKIQNLRIKNIIFILATNRPYFFAVLTVDQKNNLVSS